MRPARVLTPVVLVVALAVSASPAAGLGEPPLPATEISQVLTLQEAASRGMVTLSAKGGTSGDQVRVDLRHAHTTKPVRVTIRIDFTGFGRPDVARPAIATAVRRGVAELNRRVTRAPGVPPVEFDDQYTVSARGTPKPPGSHQVRVIQAGTDYRSNLERAATPNAPDGVSGTWSIGDVLDPTVFAHEALHLAGLPDRYTTSYREPGTGRTYPAPTNLTDRAAVDAWARAHVPPLRPGGRYASRGRTPCDLMATLAACSRLRPADIRRLVAQSGTRLEVKPGDVLANKDGTYQDFGVSQPLDLFAPRGGTASVNGLVVYCIDLEGGTPSAGQLFDAAGPAAGLGGEGNARLQRVLEYIATLPAPPGGPADFRPGAQFAVWAVTNEVEPGLLGDDARAVLQGAVLAPGGPLPPDTPNPNAGSPATGAVAPDGTVVPPPPPAPPQPPARVVLERAELTRTTFRARRGVRVLLRVSASGGPATVRVAVQRRRGARWVPIGAFPARRIGAGGEDLGLRLPALPAGDYRVRVTGAGAVTTPFTVRG